MARRGKARRRIKWSLHHGLAAVGKAIFASRWLAGSV